MLLLGQTLTRAEIVIEERPAEELKSVAGTRIAPDDIAVWNPAFDTTPARLITAIVTDKGVIRKKEGETSIDVNAFCKSHSVSQVT